MLPERPGPKAKKGEKEVFRLIKQAQHSDRYVCLHSLGLARHQRKSYAEADFVVIAPSGVFCLEAKGGHVKRQDGTWTIGWPGSTYTSTEGPFKQAQGAIYPLIDEIERRLSSDFKRKVPVGWGVVFPDIRFTMEDPEWDLAVVCDSTKINDFTGYIERLADYTRERERLAGRTYPQHLPEKDLDRLIECFRRDFDLVPRVADLILESERELAELSEQQYEVLQYALDPSNSRVLCPGAAGTGKTLIGLEAARRVARQGKRVLFICFNRLLALHLRREIEPEDRQVEVWSLHQFMRKIIQDAGLREQLSDIERHSSDANALFREKYPDLFETAMLELADHEEVKQFDFLIVDEGQDVLFSPIIDALGLALKGGLSQGRWLLLFDPDLQSEIYGRMDDRVLDYLRSLHPATLRLHENFRNPEPIVDEICAITGVEKPRCRRRLMSRVEYRTFRSEQEQGKRLRALLLELLGDGVRASDVTILSPRRQEESCVEIYPPDVGRKVIYLDGRSPDFPDAECFTACSVSQFKGLENEIIIMTDLPDWPHDDAWSRSVVYVGMSRARTRLYAMVSEEQVARRFGSSDVQPSLEATDQDA